MCVTRTRDTLWMRQENVGKTRTRIALCMPRQIGAPSSRAHHHHTSAVHRSDFTGTIFTRVPTKRKLETATRWKWPGSLLYLEIRRAFFGANEIFLSFFTRRYKCNTSIRTLAQSFTLKDTCDTSFESSFVLCVFNWGWSSNGEDTPGQSSIRSAITQFYVPPVSATSEQV